MLLSKFKDYQTSGSGEFFKGFTTFGNGSHFGHVTKTIFINVCTSFPRRL